MSDFKAKMHQNSISAGLGLCPRPCWSNLQYSPHLLTGFKRPTSKRRGGEGRGDGREGKEREVRGM